jgi:hypothetical protein
MSDDLSRVMRSATENLHPNIGKLTSGGIERGVRKRRARRITQIAGGAASVTAVFAVVAAVGTPGHGASGGNVSAASGTSTTPAAVASSSTAAAPSTSSTSSAAAKSAAPVSGEDMVKWLKQELAPYHFSGEDVLFKGGTDDAANPYATLKIGYSSGVGSLSLSVTKRDWGMESHTGLVPYITDSNLPDGSHLEVFNGPEWPAGNGDPKAKRLDVAWYRTDGTMVDIMVLNEAMEKGATTASGLGLTVDQATKLVQSPVWDQAIASVLAKPAPGKTPPPHAPGLYVGSGNAATSPTSTPAH